VIRQQVQVVAAAASQPVLMQVAQEVQMEQLMASSAALQEKLSEDPQLQELMARMFERVQDDSADPSSPADAWCLFGGMGGLGGMTPGGTDLPPDDRQIPRRPAVTAEGQVDSADDRPTPRRSSRACRQPGFADRFLPSLAATRG